MAFRALPVAGPDGPAFVADLNGFADGALPAHVAILACAFSTTAAICRRLTEMLRAAAWHGYARSFSNATGFR